MIDSFKRINKSRLYQLIVILFLYAAGNCYSQTDKCQIMTDSLDYIKLIDSSFMYGDRSEYDQAINYLRKAIDKYPDNPTNIMLINNIGGIYQLLGQYDHAIMSYSAALQKAPDAHTIRYNRALLQGKLKRNKEAITDFCVLIASNPNNQLYRYQRGILYLLEKDYDLAESDFMNIIDNDSESIKAREGLAMLETIRKNYDKAERIYDYIIDKLPQYAKAYEGRSRMFLMRNMLGFALRDANKSLELSKNNPSIELLQLRRDIFIQIGDKDNARIEEDNITKLKKKLNIE